MEREIDARLNKLIRKAAAILRSYGATEIYLFGSGRTGDFDRERSDLDLAVRGIAPKDFYSAVGDTMYSLKMTAPSNSYLQLTLLNVYEKMENMKNCPSDIVLTPPSYWLMVGLEHIIAN